MIEIFFLIIFGVVIIYVLFFWFYSSIKKERDFANDVYKYLSRRYKNTTIVDYGGISSDPIVLSREAGPFKLLEVKVITEKSSEKYDQDLIIRGEVDSQKFQTGEFKPADVFVTLPSMSYRPSSNITIGDSKFDVRFYVNSKDPQFVRHLLARTNLGDLISKNFDLEGYNIRWLSTNTPVIQVRMETMSSSSFIQSFNILLGTVGALAEKGYLIRKTGVQKKATIEIPSYSPSKELKEIPSYTDKPTKMIPSYAEEPVLKETIVSQEESEFGINYSSTTSPEYPSVSTNLLEPIEILKPKIDAFEERKIQQLFDSIRYQAKELIFEPSQVRILTFSSSTEEIIVTFPEDNRALFSAFIDKSPESDFGIQVKFDKEPQLANWSDAWKDIEITGEREIVEKLKIRSAIANRITTAGYIEFSAVGKAKEGIKCQILVHKSKEGINAGYSLLKDFSWFFEMLYI